MANKAENLLEEIEFWDEMIRISETRAPSEQLERMKQARGLAESKFRRLLERVDVGYQGVLH